MQIEDGWRKPSEKRPDAVQCGHFREIETTDNLGAEPVALCEAAKTAIVVYGKRVGATLTVCTDNDCPIHDPRAAARAAEHSAPVMPAAPPAETEEEAVERKQQHKKHRKEYEAEQERQAEEYRKQREQNEQQYEAEQGRKEEQRKTRAATFERILQVAPKSLSLAQLRVLLRAIVNLDRYTFDDLADHFAGYGDFYDRSAEDFFLSVIDELPDDKLTNFAVRMALIGHLGIPREDELDFLTEADAVFTPPQKKANTTKARSLKSKNAPVRMPTPRLQPKKKTAKKQIAA